MADVAAPVVALSREGRVTLPAKMRRALGLDEGSELFVEQRNGTIVLRPAMRVPRDDAWAYTAEHRARLNRAREDMVNGRILPFGEEELRELIAEHGRGGGEVTVTVQGPQGERTIALPRRREP